MAAIDHSAYAPSAPALGFGDTLLSTMHGAFRAIRVRIAARRTHTALSRLSNRQLADIGLEATDLHGLALRMAQRSVL